jgi:hypothetical protein
MLVLVTPKVGAVCALASGLTKSVGAHDRIVVLLVRDRAIVAVPIHFLAEACVDGSSGARGLK